MVRAVKVIHWLKSALSTSTHLGATVMDETNSSGGIPPISLFTALRVFRSSRHVLLISFSCSVKDAESARFGAAAKTMAGPVTIAKTPAQNHVTAMQIEHAKDIPPDCFDDNSRYRVPPHYNNNCYQSSTLNLGQDGMQVYRPANYSNYGGYQGTKYLGLTSYGDLSEEPTEFSMSNSTAYQAATPDPVSISSYPTQNNGRSRVNPPAPMYMDSEAAPNYNQNAYQSYSARSMVDSESKNFCVSDTAYLSLYGTAATGTVPQNALNVTNGAERVLPYPSVNRQYRSTNDGTSSSPSSLQPYGFMGSNMGSSGKMNGTSIQMPLGNSYINVPTSSSQEITTEAAELAYNSSQQLSIAQQDTEMYDAATTNSSLYYSQTNDSTADISHYGTSSGSDTNKNRQSSQTNTTENVWVANNRKSSSSGSSGGSLLANGQPYVPHTQSHYPAPNIPGQMQNHGLLQQLPQISQVQHDGLPHSREYVSTLSSR
ncbi:hypothetical protein NHQ30_007319 [Ciborinia camelliae]|nr:hypothetical protein NHQ30_007319 [Ciborinia camelliae]